MLKRNVVSTTVSAPAVQYFKGSKQTEWRQAGLKHFEQSALAGFAAEADRYGEDFDAACEAAGMSQIVVLHSFNQSPTEKTYWWFGEDLMLYPITNGPPVNTIGGLLKRHEETIQAAIAVRWPREVTGEDGETKQGVSSIYVRCYEEMLLNQGYDKPVQVGIRGPMSTSFLNALLDHVRICEVADEMKRKKYNDPTAQVSLTEMAWPLAKAEEPSLVGKVQKSRVYNFRTLHPEQPDKKYLGSIYIKDEELRARIEKAIERDYPAAVEWAREFASTGAGEPGPEAEGNSNTHASSNGKNEPVAVTEDDTGEDDIPF